MPHTHDPGTDRNGTDPSNTDHDHEPAPEHDHEGEHGTGDAHPHAHDHGAGHHADDIDHLGVAVLTVSSSRGLDDDPSGDTIARAVESAGHTVVTRELVGDSYDRVQQTLDALSGRGDVDLLVSSGGTGVTPDDVTVEAVRPLLDKRLPGFGELFRRLSFDEIGPRVVATRATAGIANGVPVFCLPGSENAVTLGVEDIIIPVAGHLAGLAHEGEAADEA